MIEKNRSFTPNRKIPLWLKIIQTALVVILFPLYIIEYGPTQFLWFSNIALLTTTVALWLESRFLASMMALAAVLPEIAWNVDFFANLVFGAGTLPMTAYMFNPEIPLFMRLFSLYHVPLPILLVWLIYRLGYDARALLPQTVLAWVVFPLSYLTATDERNINLTRTFALWDLEISGPAWVALLMILAPICIYLPTHFLLNSLFGKKPREP